jgi:hypothetical protein
MDEKTLVEASIKLVENNIDKIFNFVIKQCKDNIKKSQIDFRDAFTNYLQSAIKKYNSMKTLLYTDKSIQLYEFYVNLDLACKDEITKTDNILNVIDKSRYNLITGTGGVGKSTCFKHLYLNTIHNTNLIPIFIELREINTYKDDVDFIDFIYNTIKNLKFTLEKEYFCYALQTGAFILFFDAFDEVIDEKREFVQKQIENMCDLYDLNYYFISTRPLSDNANLVGWHKFTRFNLCNLNKEQAKLLISKLNYDSDVKNNFLDELDTKLFDKYKSFTTIPLLLTIMLITYDQYSDIPDKIYLFYQQAFQTLYNRHDSSKGSYKRTFKSNLVYDDFVHILSAFSTLSYLDKNKSFSDVILYEYLKEIKDITNTNFDSKDFKQDLIESVCVLIQEGLEYVYTHRTFQEYFTANYIVYLDDKEQKQLFNLIWQKLPHSLTSDIIFDILLESHHRNRVEKNFLIPALAEIKKRVKGDTDEERYINWIKLIFSGIALQLDEEEDDDNDEAIDADELLDEDVDLTQIDSKILNKFDVFYQNNRSKTKYYNLTYYIFNKYSNTNLVKPNLLIPATNIEFKEYLATNFGVFKDIDIKKIDKNMHPYLLTCSSYFINLYIYSMDIYDYLINKHKENNSIADRTDFLKRRLQ